MTFISLPLCASDALDEEIVLDGNTYTNEEIVELFLQSAIATYDLEKKTKQNETLWGRSEMYARYPWIALHYFTDNKYPKSGVINKFRRTEISRDKGKFYEKPMIGVAVGYPNKLEDFGSSWEYWKKRSFAERYYSFYRRAINYGSRLMNIVENETMDIAEELRTYSLPVNLNYQNSEYELFRWRNSGWLAQIRVIPYGEVPEVREMPGYKQGLDAIISSSWSSEKRIYFRSFLRSSIHNKFDFTIDGHRTVEGYALTNEKNELEITFCYIWNGHKKNMRLALIKECVLRSLGLINFHSGKGFLSAWNEIPYPDSTKLSEEELRIERARFGKTPPNEIPEISELDLFLLKLLYRDDIKAGMNPEDVRQILLPSKTP